MSGWSSANAHDIFHSCLRFNDHRSLVRSFFLVVLVLFFFFSFLRADSVVTGACLALKKKRVVSKHVKTHDGGERKTPAAESRKQWRYSRILAFAEISSVECKPEISVCVKENITLILF